MALAQSHPIFTVSQYLDFERDAESRHEFLEGSVYAMAGESPRHSTICYNLYGLTHPQLRGKSCRGYSPNMKIATNNRGLYSYPDLAIVCGEPTFFDERQDVLTNPKVIFEVLSPSTQNYDRGEKMLRYTNNIETLTDYILISQDQPQIEHYHRNTDNTWTYMRVTGLEAEVVIPSIQCTLKLADVYDRVVFAQPT